MNNDQLTKALSLKNEIETLKVARMELASTLENHDPNQLRIAIQTRPPNVLSSDFHTLHVLRHPPMEMSTPDFIDLYTAKLDHLIKAKEEEFAEL